MTVALGILLFVLGAALGFLVRDVIGTLISTGPARDVDFTSAAARGDLHLGSGERR